MSPASTSRQPPHERRLSVGLFHFERQRALLRQSFTKGYGPRTNDKAEPFVQDCFESGPTVGPTLPQQRRQPPPSCLHYDIFNRPPLPSAFEPPLPLSFGQLPLNPVSTFAGR